MGVAALVSLAVDEGRKRKRVGLAAWAEAAGVLGGTAGKNPHEGIRAQVGAVEVRAAVIEHLGARRRHTRVWARARVRPGPRLALGTRRRKLQSVALDLATMAWTDQPRHVAARWTAADTARWREIRAAPGGGDDPSCRLVSDGHTVELLIDVVVDSADRLIAAVELVAHIADDDRGIVEALSQLPAATPVPGALAVRLAPDDVVVEVDARTSTTAIHGTAEVGAPAVRIRSAAELGRIEARWATPVTAAAFAASGASSLAVSLGESKLAWAKIEVELERLRAGLVVIRRIAGTDESDAPYR